ncbi:DNA mismatch repair protein MutS [Ceratobasidium sp. AG-Ba]|nr:DNA mismatch repair protein MutS [Ceratobasidium sp. AG-Ba]
MRGSSLRDLTPEIINNLAHLLEPRALLALGSISRHFRNTIFGDNAGRMLDSYILEKGIPPPPKGFTYWEWLSFLHHPCYTACGARDCLRPDAKLRVRLCHKCRETRLFELGGDDVSEEIDSILVYSNRTKGQRNHGMNYALLSEYKECTGRVAQREANGGAHANWNEWVDECRERREHAAIVQEYLDSDKAKEIHTWNQSIAAMGVLTIDPEQDLDDVHLAKWNGKSSWRGYIFSETARASLPLILNNLRSRNIYANERFELGLQRQGELIHVCYDPMCAADTELAHALSDDGPIAHATSLTAWYPVPVYEDLLALPAVKNWLRSDDLPQGTDADSWTVEIPPKVFQAIDLSRQEDRRQLAETVRTAWQIDGLNPDPPRPRYDLPNGIDLFELVTLDDSILYMAATIFYRGDEPGTEVWSLDDMVIELEDQDRINSHNPMRLNDYRPHSQASKVVNYILPVLANQNMCFMEFKTQVFRCSRCPASNLKGFEVVEHYLRAAERHKQFMTRLEAGNTEASSGYSFLHEIDTGGVTPLAEVTEEEELLQHEDPYEVACLLCKAAGVQDPIFRCYYPTICMDMCRFHVREEHNIPDEEVQNYVHVVDQ